MVDIEKIKTGIPGLDDITMGGLPKKELVLLTGTTGTGKTVMSTQFLYNGAKAGEKGIYLSFEEPEAYLRKSAAVFGWNIPALEKKGLFSFLRYDPYRISDVLDILESEIRGTGATRAVIDSISALGLYVRNDAELRRMIFDIALTLRKLDCTTIITSEIVHGKPGISRYGVEEFVADSVIVLYYERTRNLAAFNRAIQIWKLRGSPHSNKLHSYTITGKGIQISKEEAFISSKI